MPLPPIDPPIKPSKPFIFGLPFNDDQKNSSFWLGKNRIKGKADAYQLSAYRRSISNFVRILTGKQIPVTFKVEGKVSYTDGKTVILSSDISDEQFDSVVGLALHEAAHILKTDFAALKEMDKDIDEEIYSLGEAKGMPRKLVHMYFHKMWNWIEDRYIDAWVYRFAPGYQGYYDSLYARYWHSDEISEGLKSKLYRRPTLKSYSARIINLTNENTDLTALPQLGDIAKIADLENVLRLTKHSDRVEIAEKITRIVFENIKKLKTSKGKSGNSDQESQPQQSQNGEGGEPPESDPEEIIELDEPQNEPSKPDESSDESKPEDKEGEKSKPDKLDDEKEESKNSSDDASEKSESVSGNDKKTEEEKDKKNTSSESDDASKEKASKAAEDKKKKDDEKKNVELDKEEKQLDEFLDKQEKFLNGDIDKKSVPADVNENLDLLEKGSTSLIPVGEGIVPNVTCIVVKNLSKEIIQSELFPFKVDGGSVQFNNNKEAIAKGITLGTALGHKLKIRGETNSLVYMRQRNGRIEKSLIHELGFSNAMIFSKTFIDQFKKVELHVSVDISASMEGQKWLKTITCITALAKAASMIQNIEVAISFRGSDDTGRHPYLFIAYDSKKDKFTKIPSLFPYISPDNGTPEGLAFQAIVDLIPASNTSVDSYFVNFSDGEPCFGSGGRFDAAYRGEVAYNHTRTQVNKFLQKNVKVLSYFIDDDVYTSSSQNLLNSLRSLSPSVASKFRASGTDDTISAFRKMYGTAAHFIDVTSIVDIARSLNKKFLEK